MRTLNEIQKIVEQETTKNFIFQHQKPAELYAPIEYFLALGGKRIRPAFVLMSCNLFCDNIEKSIPAALAMEVFHNFTLVHDDIIDNSPLRRNFPTVHKKWNLNQAILSGDTMVFIAYQHLNHLDSKFLPKILPIFTQAAIEVCEGQQFDMQESKTENDYLKMAALKTSALLASSLKIGAIIGGANSQDAENIYQFGQKLGLAFQIQDDYLDVFGNEVTFGKSIGNDIVTNKSTFLTVKAFELADSESKNELKYYFSSTNFPADEKILAVTKIYHRLKIDEFTKNKIEKFYNESLEFLNQINVVEERKTQLKLFADQLLKRIK